jgi:hypothetical protein
LKPVTLADTSWLAPFAHYVRDAALLWLDALLPPETARH